MSEFKGKCVIGIDLAASIRNPSGWALLKGNTVKTSLVYTDSEILISKGYRVFPPNFPAMKKLALRAIRLNRLIEEKRYKTIEVHPTSTRKALQMPLKDWKATQEILKTLGLKGEVETRPLATHEIDAVTAALTAVLHLKSQTERVGDEEKGYITVPKKRDWRTLAA